MVKEEELGFDFDEKEGKIEIKTVEWEAYPWLGELYLAGLISLKIDRIIDKYI